MNQYFLMDIPLSRAYSQKNPSLKRLIDIVLPGETVEEVMSDRNRSCTKINDAIDKYIKATFNRNTADLNLDEFVERYGDGKVDLSSTKTFRQAVIVIHNNRDLLRKNINKGKYNPSGSDNDNSVSNNQKDKDMMELIHALSQIYDNTDEYLNS